MTPECPKGPESDAERQDAATFASLYRSEQHRANELETLLDKTEDTYSELLRGMAARASELRRSLKFADAHVPQWERVIAEHKAEIERLSAIIRRSDAVDKHNLQAELKHRNLRYGIASATIGRLRGDLARARQERDSHIEHGSSLAAEVERLRGELRLASDRHERETAQIRGELRIEEDNVAFAEKTLHLVLRCCDGEQDSCAALEAVYGYVRLGGKPPVVDAVMLPPYEDVVDAVRVAVGRKDERDEEAVTAVLDYLRSRGVSSSEVEAPQPQEMEQHKVTVTRFYTTAIAFCPTCETEFGGTHQAAEDWKDQHEADTLRPQVESPNHQANQHDEGRPSGSKAAEPQAASAPAWANWTECMATEGATGIDCYLTPGHHQWHSGRHTPRTDGTESVGYPLNVQWPRQEWDICAPEKNTWQRGDREPDPLVSSVKGWRTGTVYDRRLEGFGGPWDYQTSDGRAWSTWDRLIEEERGAELPHAPQDAAQAARSEATPRLRSCVEAWPDCEEGAYNPSCCRFPKSCSCTIYDAATVDPKHLESPSPSLRKEGEDSE